jgi:alkylated DNA repair dioxygenase AlkB
VTQLSFLSPSTFPPEGLRYESDVISRAQEAELTDTLATLAFEPFQFHGFVGKRRTVSFGYHYAFDGSGLHETTPVPDFLLPVRAAAARFAMVEPEALAHALVIEYAPGAGIGWHRDRPVFGEVVGVSLLAPARLRFRHRTGQRWERAHIDAAPRSAYHLTGSARWEWEHSIPPLEALRYSITFRTLRSVGDVRPAA